MDMQSEIEIHDNRTICNSYLLKCILYVIALSANVSN